jgi:PTH1 family peptidyl-tRNA hydrolase
MKLIVGLGNPGKEYYKTRHNVGFDVLENYLNEKNLSLSKEKFNGLYTETNINGEKIIFLEPQKYMNLSGEVVKKYVDFYKIDISDILIIQDDLDQELGKIKLKENSSSGGHNGIKNIELHLGTKNYKRLKIGISNNKNVDTKDYVLGKLSKEDRNILDQSIKKCSNIIDDFLVMDFSRLMNKYN